MARFRVPFRLAVIAFLGVLCTVLARATEPGLPRGEFIAIAYRSIEDRDPDVRFGALETAKLAEEFDWLRAHDYQPVSLDDLLAASRGARLPPKPVLLTFDDGWENFYTRVFPLLRAYRYPAIVGIVEPFASAAPGTIVRYGDADIPRENFMNWDQIREVARSGLVEVAAQARVPMPGSTSGGTHLEQERQDLAAASNLLQQKTGRMVRAMISPRGGDGEQAAFLATSLGLTTVLTIEPANGTIARTDRIPRRLVEGNPGMGEFIDRVLRTPSVSISVPFGASPQSPQPVTAR